ncbi:MAG: hypothetical protein JXA10_08365 [Anaerolineae bacterium]|nr:hypothetical protein [Anaerolineae bacterium]
MFESLVFLIRDVARGLYIISMGGILFMALRLRGARRELSMSQFTLEREHALVKQANAITFGGLMIEFLIAIWAIANVMAPTIDDIQAGDQAGGVPPMERFVTSTPAPNPPVALGVDGAIDTGPDLFASPVPTVTPVGTIMPDAPDIVGCANDAAWIHVPGNGQLLFEATTVLGTASVSDFAFYRFEIKQAVTGAEFAPIGGDKPVPVVNGPLGEILPFSLPTGEYRFRLVVFDNTQTLRASCEITIHISEPPPTATPIGG